MLVLPNKFNVLSCEVDEGLSNIREIFDPYTHGACCSKECMNVCDCLAWWPSADFGNFRVIRDASFISALVSEDNDFRSCNKNLLS